MSKIKRGLNLAAVAAVAGLAVMPVSVQAVTDTADITASVGSTISMTNTGVVNINLAPGATAVVSSASDAVSVSTNSTKGYNLAIRNDANTNLVSGSNNIAQHTGSVAAPSTLANNTWGFRVVGEGGFGPTAYTAESNATSSTSTWAGITSTDAVVKTTASTASNDSTEFWYGVKVDSTQPTGSYTDTVTYTAVVNP